MDERTRERVKALLGAPGASDEAIDDAQRALGLEFPQGYVELVKEANGGEGFIGDGGYLSFFPVDKLAEYNADYETEQMAPGYVLFGSSGGGSAYAFDRGSGAIVSMPMAPLDDAEEVVERLGETFEAFLAALEQQTDED